MGGAVCQTKRNKKGRAIGMLLGVREEFQIEDWGEKVKWIVF